jgi:hypothetical protein
MNDFIKIEIAILPLDASIILSTWLLSAFISAIIVEEKKVIAPFFVRNRS